MMASKDAADLKAQSSMIFTEGLPAYTEPNSHHPKFSSSAGWAGGLSTSRCVWLHPRRPQGCMPGQSSTDTPHLRGTASYS